MTEASATTYDELPYHPSYSFPQTHPDRLAVIARLFGLAPPPLDGCRVLELACGCGGNLIPMAAHMPGASFVGVDLSARQIGEAQATIGQLKLPNIELRHQSITAVDASMGTFDYIIAHGVYSWVPPEVQDRILTICRENLVPNGVAFVSYNTYPGWRMRGTIRDLMLYHSLHFPDSTTKVQQARALLEFLATNVPADGNPYGILLKQEMERLRTRSDSHLVHEYLAGTNEPLYFHQFAERADVHGLQYLGEADFAVMVASNLPGDVAAMLHAIVPDIIRMEQYMDFVRNRMFRQTLLVHREARLTRNLDPASLQGLYVASAAQPTSADTDLCASAAAEFRAPNGAALKTSLPILKAAMTVLGERWPQSLRVDELAALARHRLADPPPSALPASAAEADFQALGRDLLVGFASGVVELNLRPDRFVTDLSERPRANPLARHQAATGVSITNLRHEAGTLDDFDRQLLQRLDGTRNRAALVDELGKVVAEGVLIMRQGDQTVTDARLVRTSIEQAVNDTLPRLARAALLEG